MFRHFYLVLACSLLVFSTGASALGLGEIKLKSGLNQPLLAEIELFSAEGMSEFEVAASLASLVEFEKSGIDFFGYLRNIRFKTIAKEGDRLVVEVTTRQPVKEPYLNFLVELNWPKGRMLREYTLLLDPPVFQETGSAQVNQAAAAPVEVSQSSSPQQAPQYTQAAPTTTAATTPRTFTGNSYGPVSRNQTLWRIATDVRPANLSIQQTLVALYRANPAAFVNNDINKLKEGATLQVPSAEDIASIPRRAALQDMVARTRGNRREAVLDTSGRSADAGQAVESGDRLRLSSPGAGSGVSGTGGRQSEQISNLREQLAVVEEGRQALEDENAALRRQLQQALDQLENQDDQGVAVESPTGALLAGRETTANDNDDAVVPEQSATDSVAATTDSAAATGTDEQSPFGEPAQADSGSEMNTDAASGGDTSSTEATSQPAQQTPSRPAPKLIPAPQPTSMFDDPLVLAGGGIAIVLLGGALFVFWRMRQRMSDDEFQDDLVVSAQGAGFDLGDSVEMPDVGDELLEDLGDGTSIEGDGQAEADPLGEADIYIAYGKYDQAENLLRGAIEEFPSRTDLKVKLLECYAETKNREAFDAFEAEHVGELNSDPVYAQEVSSLKLAAWPGDSEPQDDFELPSTEEIFSEEEFSSSSSDDDFSLDDSTDSIDDELDSLLNDTNSDESTDFDTDDLDFNLDDEPAVASSAETLVSGEADIIDDLAVAEEEFSLDDDDLDLESDLDLDLGDSDVSLDDMDTSDLDLDLSDNETSSDALDDDDSLGLDMDSDFDLGDDEGLDDEFADAADEASTKLDLARAYIDMGDAEGAKEILNEVIEEGNEGHKTEAMSLLEKI